jgi:hypothetical protein
MVDGIIVSVKFKIGEIKLNVPERMITESVTDSPEPTKTFCHENAIPESPPDHDVADV